MTQLLDVTGNRYNLGYFVSIVKRDHPDWPRLAIQWQAKRMYERHPFIEKAVNAGLENGRDLRERMEHGLGVWWKEMEALTPEERGFVLVLVREKVQPRKPLLRVVADEFAEVRRRQEDDAYETRADELAADWRVKSDAPDARVKAEKTFGDWNGN